MTTKPMATKLALLLVALLALPAAAAPATSAATAPATRPAFTLGQDTTRITAPLLPDGRPVAALDQAMAKGVTPENNVVAGMIEIFGADDQTMPAKTRAEALKRLGITGETKGPQFVGFQEYLKKLGKDYSQELSDQEDQALAGPWDPEEFPELAKWLTAQDPALNQIVNLSARPRFYWPMIATTDRAGMVSVLLPRLGQLRGAGFALVTRAMLRLEGGKIKECQSDLIAAHRLARLLSQGPTLIEKLVAVATEKRAAKGDAQLAESLKAAEAKAYLAELEKLPAMHGVAESIDVAERYMMLDAVLSLAKYGPAALREIQGVDTKSEPVPAVRPGTPAAWATEGVDWDKLLKRVNGYYDRLVAAMALPPQQRKAAMDAIDKEMQQVGTRATSWVPQDRTTRLGDMLIALLMPSLGRAGELADLATMRSELGKLAVALAAYRGEKGGYPEKLDDLSPTYLKEIPKDLFAGAPLKYRQEGKGYLLYSIGPNLVDDNGVAGKRDNTGDMVVKMRK